MKQNETPIASSSLFQRLILPGFAFKAVVIGGGYATGRELVEFFGPSGPVGGLLGLLVTTMIWSTVCAATFAFAHHVRGYNYRDFFSNLLGRFWFLFEIAFFGLMLLILSVFGAAAGEIGAALLGWPTYAGMLVLALSIVGFAAFGNRSVEQLFKYVSILLYATYILFIILVFSGFGEQVLGTIARASPASGWFGGGVTYAVYNVVGAVVILPVIRHVTTRREAVVAGLISGPLAALPAFLFFIGMMAFYPEILDQTLPSDYILSRLDLPVFHYGFQLMVFAALLESGTGLVHSMNESFASFLGNSRIKRAAVASCMVLLAMIVAGRVGLIELIAHGYGASAYVFIAIFLLPLFTLGMWRLVSERA